MNENVNIEELTGPLNTAILSKLDELIHAIRAPKLPANKELWDASQCAEYLKVTRR